MFSDPFVLTRRYTTLTADAAGNGSFAATERAADHSTYRLVDADGNDHVLFMGHQYGKRWRFTARYDVSGLVPSLVVPTENNSFKQSVYVVVDAPQTGIVRTTSTQNYLMQKQLVGIGSLLVQTSTTDPILQRLIDGET